MVPLYKNKGDIKNCNNYRDIKLLSHTMKVWERVVEMRVRKVVSISENQFGFMPGRSTTEAIHLVRRLVEKIGKERRTFIWCSLISRRPMTRFQRMSYGGVRGERCPNGIYERN